METDIIAVETVFEDGFETDFFRFGHAAYDTAPDFKERMLRFLPAE